jgi:hypothetical protein
MSNRLLRFNAIGHLGTDVPCSRTERRVSQFGRGLMQPQASGTDITSYVFMLLGRSGDFLGSGNRSANP